MLLHIFVPHFKIFFLYIHRKSKSMKEQWDVWKTGEPNQKRMSIKVAEQAGLRLLPRLIHIAWAGTRANREGCEEGKDKANVVASSCGVAFQTPTQPNIPLQPSSSTLTAVETIGGNSSWWTWLIPTASEPITPRWTTSQLLNIFSDCLAW